MNFVDIASTILFWQWDSTEPTFDELRALDEWANNDEGPLRSVRFEAYRFFTLKTREKSIDLLRKYPRLFGLNVLASMADDGWVRAAACHNLASIGGPALPYLMLRAYDWYSPTAEQALTAFRNGLRAASTRDLERCLILLGAIDRA